MIDLNKIEAAAKDAPYEAEWRYEPTGQTVWAGNTYMVADIRGWGHLQYMLNGEKLQDATGVHIATANPQTVLEMVSMIRERDAQVAQLQEQNTYLDKVASELQDLCDRQASMLGKRDAVLDQVLELLGPQAPECCGCAAEWNLAIAAIKEILNEPTKP